MKTPEGSPPDVAIELREAPLPREHEWLTDAESIQVLENTLELGIAARLLTVKDPILWWGSYSQAEQHTVLRATEILEPAIAVGSEQHLNVTVEVAPEDRANAMMYDTLWAKSQHADHLSLLDALSKVTAVSMVQVDSLPRPDDKVLTSVKETYAGLADVASAMLYDLVEDEIAIPFSDKATVSPQLSRLNPTVLLEYLDSTFVVRNLIEAKRRHLKRHDRADDTYAKQIRFWRHLRQQRELILDSL